MFDVLPHVFLLVSMVNSEHIFMPILPGVCMNIIFHMNMLCHDLWLLGVCSDLDSKGKRGFGCSEAFLLTPASNSLKK